jgi:cyclic lactone autoinducer peptide
VKNTYFKVKRHVLLNVAALLGLVALGTVTTNSAWYVYSAEVPEELLK